MDKVIPYRLREQVFIYLDDLLVRSTTFDDHLSILREVAAYLQGVKLTINLTKSKFCQAEIKFLDYWVGRSRQRTNFPHVRHRAKYGDLLEWQTNIKDLSITLPIWMAP